MPMIDLQPEILSTLKSIERLLVRVANNTSRDHTYIVRMGDDSGLPTFDEARGILKTPDEN